MTTVNQPCPRCGEAAEQRFYGPCADCRQALHVKYSGEAREDVTVGAYEPKMNVTPNAVALKD